ncbi:MAG TPA: transglycosylase SLT domain-containing protein [Rudaea sp.]|nr:transglycosylase SLT domain-containing protein [Rudaea sp.]
MSQNHFSRNLTCLLLFFFIVVASPVSAAPLAGVSRQRLDQRERFMLIWEAAQHGPDRLWRKLAVGMESYPLYPYLELASLQRRMPTLPRKDVDKFLAAWPDSLPAHNLREDFLLELASRGDWKDFLDLYAPAQSNTTLRCDALKARISLLQTPDFEKDIQPIWLSANPLPSACDDVVAWATAHGKFSDTLIWQRIELAAKAGHAGLVDTLSNLLHGTQRAAALRIKAAIVDPAGALNQATSWPDSAHARQALVTAFTRLVRRDSDSAESQWTRLGKQFHFDASQRDTILHAIALYRAADYAPDALTRLEQLPASAHDDATREWRVRVALAAKDWKKALLALDAMSQDQRADAQWRYLRARMLAKLGRREDAAKQFAAISNEANFHGFLAADWLNEPYTICPAQPPRDALGKAALEGNPDLARAFEFFALKQLPQARREWNFAMARLKVPQRRLAADVAAELGWIDRAVYAFGQGDDMRQYALRFPLARRTQLVRDAHAAGIEPAWAYAILRAESAWTTDAHSGADAYGLMQLLPDTARRVAKAQNISFPGASALFDPELNIKLGTSYLGAMAVRYDGSPWLASAAYNAGPAPVAKWINARDTLDPDFFIETIPYKETRAYVARVLAFTVIYDWRLHGNAIALSSRLARIGQTYSAPTAKSPRKSVTCPASAAPPANGQATTTVHDGAD